MTVFAALAVAVAPVHVSASQPILNATPAQCAIALEKVKSVVRTDYSKPVVFDVADENSTYQFLRPEGLIKGWARYEGDKRIDLPGPPLELAQDFVKRGMQNAVARCGEIRTWLKTKKVPFGARAVKAVVAREKNDELPAGIFSIAVPVVSADGKIALLYASDVWGGEGAGGFVEMFERQVDGSWKSVATLRLWIS